MRKRWLWVCVGLVILNGGIGVVFLESTHTVSGFFAGDAFYQGRPTRYWREILRANGRNNTIPFTTVRQFFDIYTAFPVLRECASDPDRNVRWPAIYLLGRGEARSEKIVSVLVGALDDEDMEVRLQAISALDHWGPTARSAIPALVHRLKDPELQVAHYADIALWDIDPSAAVKLCGWRPFTSERWGFTVIVPAEPEESEKPILDWNPLVVHTFMTWHRAGNDVTPTNYCVGVREYAAESLQLMKREDIVAEGQKQVLQILDGKLVRKQPVELHGNKGMEYVIEVETKGTMRSRFFWSGRRLYQIQVVGKPPFLNTRAAEYFMESFQLDKRERKATVPSGSPQPQEHQHRE